MASLLLQTRSYASKGDASNEKPSAGTGEPVDSQNCESLLIDDFPTSFGIRVMTHAQWEQIDPLSLVKRPVIINRPSGAIIQSSVISDALPSAISSYAETLLLRSKKLYENDRTQVAEDHSFRRSGTWDLGEEDELYTASYEVNGAVIQVSDDTFIECESFTSNQKHALIDQEGSGPHTQLIEDIQTRLKSVHLQEGFTPTVYILHTHPYYSALSVPDVRNGHLFLAENLKKIFGSKINMHFFAVSKTAEKIVLQGQGRDTRAVISPGQLLFMHDHTNSVPSGL